jgi:hypothetical protein
MNARLQSGRPAICVAAIPGEKPCGEKTTIDTLGASAQNST